MRMIAFTSVSHFGFIVLGIFALTTTAGSGSVLYMINHGFSTAALFLVVATGFGRGDLIGVLWSSPLRRLMRTPEQGADTLVWLATAPADQLRPGGYYVDRRPGLVNPQALSGRLARQLWDRSERLVGLAEHPPR